MRTSNYVLPPRIVVIPESLTDQSHVIRLLNALAIVEGEPNEVGIIAASSARINWQAEIEVQVPKKTTLTWFDDETRLEETLPTASKVIADIIAGNFKKLFVLAFPANSDRYVGTILADWNSVILGKSVALGIQHNELKSNSPLQLYDECMSQLTCGIAIAYRVVANGGSAVLVNDSDNLSKEFDRVSSSDVDFSFRLASTAEIENPDFFPTLTLRRKAGLNFRESLEVPSHEKENTVRKRLHFDPMAENDACVNLEFPDVNVREDFLDICKRVYLQDEKSPAIPIQRKNLRLLLTAARVCRSLAVRTLEGTPFWSTILMGREFGMTSGDKFGTGKLLPVFTIDQQPRIYFNFDCKDEIDAAMEIAQGENLWAYLDRNDGALAGFCAMRESWDYSTRQTEYGKYLTDGGVLIHIHDRGQLDLFARPGDKSHDYSALWYDGFRWLRRRFRDLLSVLDRMKGGEGLGDCRSNIEQAICMLLQSNESSIVVILPNKPTQELDDDLNSLPGIKLEKLRNHIIATDQAVLGNLRPEVLTSILHLDGAHFLTSDGRIVRICQLIHKDNGASTVTGDEIPKTDVIKPTRQTTATGSGTTSASLLFESLKNSANLADAAVIKVSASGRIRIWS